MSSTKRVSVIIPHYNDLSNLALCLADLRAQTLPKDRFEVIVADNNSKCGLAAVAAVVSPFATLVPAPIQGAAQARNAALQVATGEMIAFIDSDCRPAPDWLERGLAALAQADMVGGDVAISVRDEDNLTAVEAFERVFAFNCRRYVEDEGYSVTANMFVPRAVFDRVGGFRDGVSEDKDWGERAVRLGYRWIYAADVRVRHPARREWSELVGKTRRLTRESFLLAKEQPNGTLKWVLRSWVVLVSPFVHWIRIATSPALRSVRERIGAIVILFRIRMWRFIEAYRVLA